VSQKWKDESLPLLLVVAAWSVLWFFWDRLPARVPVHWGVSGSPDAYASKVPAAFMLPAICSIVILAMVAWSSFIPLSASRESLLRVFRVVKVVVSASFCALTCLTLQAAVSPGGTLATPWLMALIGVMFVVLGDRLPKIRPNTWLGIRTPWTLAHPEVWERTHHLMGRWFVLSGLLVILAAVLPATMQVAILMLAILGVSAGSLVVPILEYRKVLR
jgi:uncharacterized membrane protein